MAKEIKRWDDNSGNTDFQNRTDRFLSVKIVMSCLGAMLLLLFGFVGAGAISDIKELQKDKIGKEQYYRDLDSINKNLNDIAEFVKKLER